MRVPNDALGDGQDRRARTYRRIRCSAAIPASRRPRRQSGWCGRAGEHPGIEPALFRDTPATRAILKAGAASTVANRAGCSICCWPRWPATIAQLQNLAAGELAYEPELGERLRDADRARIEKTVRDNVKTPVGVRAPAARGRVAHSRRRSATGGKAPRLEIVTTTPVDGYADKASDPVSLILTALEVLDRYAVKVPPDALKRWVWNPNPPLVERVCVMLRREAPEQERSTIQQALADPKLPETTRKFLNDHLRRLDRIE